MARKYNYDPNNRPTCQNCRKNLVARVSHYGKFYWRKYCHTCMTKKYVSSEKLKIKNQKNSKTWVQHQRELKMNLCRLCGFMPKHSCQMDWDHIDGDHYNDSPENIQLLCANCHRLKTLTNGDFKSNKVKGKSLAVAQ